jgi:hypothetical protein
MAAEANAVLADYEKAVADLIKWADGEAKKMNEEYSDAHEEKVKPPRMTDKDKLLDAYGDIQEKTAKWPQKFSAGSACSPEAVKAAVKNLDYEKAAAEIIQWANGETKKLNDDVASGAEGADKAEGYLQELVGDWELVKVAEKKKAIDEYMGNQEKVAELPVTLAVAPSVAPECGFRRCVWGVEGWRIRRRLRMLEKQLILLRM